MEDKWTNRAVGAGVGAIAMLFALPFGAGWYTSGGAKALAHEAVTNVLMPLCVEAVLANPAAVAELKIKRITDYDDVVRDHLKTIGTHKTDLTFWRACGKLLEGRVERTASN
jgi:L-aminopeptidase/D-esterase-like protein